MEIVASTKREELPTQILIPKEPDAFWSNQLYSSTFYMLLLLQPRVKISLRNFWSWTNPTHSEVGSWFLRSWLVFLFWFFYLQLTTLFLKKLKLWDVMHVGRELNPFLGTFWWAWRLFIWVGSPLQNLFWSLFDLFMMIQICYDHIAFWSFGVFFFHFFSTSNFCLRCILSYVYYFLMVLLCNVFLLSHWLLCKEKNKVNYIIILLFLPHFHKEARNQLTGRSNWLKDSIGHLVFRDLTFCHCCRCP